MDPTLWSQSGRLEKKSRDDIAEQELNPLAHTGWGRSTELC